MKLHGLSWKSVLHAILLGFLILTIPAAALAETSIKMSYNGPPTAEDNAVHVFATHFKEIVEKDTNGTVAIELFPNSQLGNEQQRMEQVMTDPMINVASFGGMETVFPEIFATNVPFLFDNYKAAHIFFDSSPVMAKLRKEFRERTGIQLLEVIEEGGFIAFTCTKPIRSPKDFNGLKFRAMDASQVAMYEAFGATGTPIPWTEVYLALKTGVADGQMNPPTYIIIGSLFEVQNHLTLANVQYSDQFLLANNAMMEKLSEKERSAVLAAAKKANQLTREFVESQVESRINFLQEKGMQVYRPTPEEMKAFKDLSTPSYIAWLSKQINREWIDQSIADAQRANDKVK
ncbi:TRAP transporter substrate-binding protein DctP [Halodesulfovibrio aestuarii]|uniref:TRAP transporter substrate-binding protein n=1 Tax=Halodesulfovibrio aestuarii TaxID=126333 RepID=UPI0035202AF6